MSHPALKLSLSACLAMLLTTAYSLSALSDTHVVDGQGQVDKKTSVTRNPFTGTKTTTTTRKHKKTRRHQVGQQPGHRAHVVTTEDTRKTVKKEDRDGALLKKSNELKHDVKHDWQNGTP